MDKLELRHICPYLPYGLECIYSPTGNKMTIDGVSFMFGDYCIHMKENSDGHGFGFIKPLLRPLSNLTKEIEHNGEKFVPIEWLEEKYYTLDLHEQCERLIEDERWINQCSYLLVQHLHEWHFDTENLIEKGLAIEKK